MHLEVKTKILSDQTVTNRMFSLLIEGTSRLGASNTGPVGHIQPSLQRDARRLKFLAQRSAHSYPYELVGPQGLSSPRDIARLRILAQKCT